MGQFKTLKAKSKLISAASNKFPLKCCVSLYENKRIENRIREENSQRKGS